MTGHELAKAVRHQPGRIRICGTIGVFAHWFFIPKPDLIDYLTQLGDAETGADLDIGEDGVAVIASAY